MVLEKVYIPEIVPWTVKVRFLVYPLFVIDFLHKQNPLLGQKLDEAAHKIKIQLAEQQERKKMSIEQALIKRYQRLQRYAQRKKQSQSKRILYEQTLNEQLTSLTPYRTLDGIEWICIPLVEKNRSILEMVIRFLEETVKYLPSSLPGLQEYENTLNSTIFILQTMLGISPNKSILRNNSSRFITIRPNSFLYQSDLRQRKKCDGYLVWARWQKKVVMSMTVWKKTMFDVMTKKNVRVQEHALIVRNPYIESKTHLRNISLKMHSFAANMIHQPFIVCHPYKKMGQILKKALKQNIIHNAHLQQIGDRCTAFGSSFQFINDEYFTPSYI